MSSWRTWSAIHGFALYIKDMDGGTTPRHDGFIGLSMCQ
jgi:hypothetical protein